MPENANFLPYKVTGSNARSPALVDAQAGVVTGDAVSATYNVAAATVIKAAPGKLARITIQSMGTAGAFVINNLAANSGAALGNQIASIAYNATGVVPGVPIVFEWPCSTGILVSAVTTGGVLSVSYV